ncbi:MAG: hypothetical protein JWO11_3728 [Nocardioides sp.]|nr:hypothetical protein [Nocardioides sp.]
MVPLGATVLTEFDHHIMMADPEGNESDLC